MAATFPIALGLASVMLGAAGQMINTAGGLLTADQLDFAVCRRSGVMVSAANSMRDDGETAGVRPVEVPASVRERDRLRGLGAGPADTRSAVLARRHGVTAETTAKRDAENETVDDTRRDEYPPVERVYLTGRSGADGAFGGLTVPSADQPAAKSIRSNGQSGPSSHARTARRSGSSRSAWVRRTHDRARTSTSSRGDG